MDRNRLAGFGFVLFGLSLLRPILTASSIGRIGVFNLLMAVGGLALASSGGWMIYRGDASEVAFVPSRRAGAVLALAAASIFVGVFAHAFVG